MKKIIATSSLLLILPLVGFAQYGSVESSVSVEAEAEVRGSVGKPKPLEEVKEIRQEVKNTIKWEREEVKTDIKNIRAGAKASTSAERIELKNEAEKNREELKSKANSLREKCAADPNSDDCTTLKISLRAEAEVNRKAMEEKREEFRKEVEARREEVKKTIEARREAFKEQLKEYKDKRRAAIAEKIDENLNQLNEKITENLTERIDVAAKILAKIQSRATKAAAAGKNIDEVTAAIGVADTAIVKARAAISAQAAASYGITLSTESNLGQDAKVAREKLAADIKAVRALVDEAQKAVRAAAEALAKIPEVDDEGTVTGTASTTITTQ